MEALQPTILPSKEQIQVFPVFQNLPMPQIQLIHSLEQCLAVEQELKSCALFGFDSESKPTFKVGEISTGPHLIQLATLDKAYLFQMNPAIWAFLAPIFANRDQIKVGFGLKNDAHLFRKRGIELNSVIELSKCFGYLGLKNPVGLKNAIALLFGLNFPKSKRISTSNWASKNLSAAQIDYAAADAYAPVLVFEELLRRNLLPKEIPNTSLKLRLRPSSRL
ncbi:3'-5' exonuclease domain-containing protein 2 [Acinetobacter pseudolwoffii]|uniref:3'-5' exonuclease n=1 Tax=Acinetobacter pseudolwoffii TaxID=2053287 RepID=UPI001CE22BF4|nr:3'-5' exonuclease [Acinetobacter pseudolwoffii]UBX52257.1 3'-5' exonuclease domain-containing protein 2 [Acinetobacter pseudolwoffii]